MFSTKISFIAEVGMGGGGLGRDEKRRNYIIKNSMIKYAQFLKIIMKIQSQGFQDLKDWLATIVFECIEQNVQDEDSEKLRFCSYLVFYVKYHK